MKPQISVIIVTKNRPNDLKSCLVSLLNNTYSDFDIFVADQSDNNLSNNVVRELKANKIHYFHMDKSGKSLGLNFLIKKTRTKYLAFTDDDCIVDKKWLSLIMKQYKKHKKISGVFGTVLPFKPEKNKLMLCPSTFQIQNEIFHTKDNFDYYNIGLGNNMSLKRDAIISAGKFKEWLGPGAFGKNGEESELIYRLIFNNNTLLTSPDIIIYHNKWLTNKEEKKIQIEYTFGFIFFLSYYLITENYSHSLRFIQKKFKERIIVQLINCFNLLKYFIRETIYLFIEFISLIVAVFLGVMFKLFYKINRLFP